MATADFTITLPSEAAEYIQERIAGGEFRSASEYLERLVVGDMLGPIPEDNDLVHWMNTEGARRLGALHTDPSSGLTIDQAFAGLVGDDLKDQNEVG